MLSTRMRNAFSTNRLGGEPLPADLLILLGQRDELADRTGIELSGKKGWAPWADTSYLSDEDRRNPDVMANVRAISEVCTMIAFVAATEDDDYFGYWRGTNLRLVADSPLVRFDSEGQFQLCGRRFADAILDHQFDPDDRADLQRWLRSLGITARGAVVEDHELDPTAPTPDSVHQALYRRYLQELTGG